MLVLLLFVSLTIGQVAVIVNPIKDAKVAKAQPTANFGTSKYMMVNDKSNAVDRSYLGFDLSNTGLANISDAKLNVWVYWTGGSVVGSVIEAWYCADVDFNELTINWNNQPASWNKNGNHLSGNCILADNYTITNSVIAGSPETFHEWNLTNEVNDSLSSDKKFSIVLKHDTETAFDNKRFVQYLTKDYAEVAFRPQIVIS
jgi:hypothetical protein